jgi:hypothetical protein
LRRERELCADALAVGLTGDPISLASALESVARSRLTSPSPDRRAPLFGASLGGENLSLLPRIQELLGMTPTHPARRSLWPWASLPAAGLLAILGASLGLAADPPKPAKPVPAESPKRAPVYGASEPEFKIGQVETPFCPAQTCYEFRIISTVDPKWRDTMIGRMREVHRDVETTAWILDQKLTSEFITSVRGDRGTNILQMPKVTAIDGTLATIDAKIEPEYAADLKNGISDPLSIRPTPLSIHPITKPLDLGRKIGVTGLIRPNSIWLDVDIQDTWLVPNCQRKDRAKLKGKKSQEDAVRTAEAQVPAIMTKHFGGSKEIPDGSSLLISMGSCEVPGEIPPVMNLAIEVVHAFVGGPRPEVEALTQERLVLITPRVLVRPRDAKPFTSADQKSHPYFGALETGLY